MVSHSYKIVRCKPLTKDHLPLKTAFSGPKGWLLVTSFTALSHIVINIVKVVAAQPALYDLWNVQVYAYFAAAIYTSGFLK